MSQATGPPQSDLLAQAGRLSAEECDGRFLGSIGSTACRSASGSENLSFRFSSSCLAFRVPPPKSKEEALRGTERHWG